VVPNRLCEVLALLLGGGCGWLPPDGPAVKPAPANPDAALFRDWKVTGHVLGAHALISDYDAAGFVGRSVAVSEGGYGSPWSGSCDQTGRQKTARVAAEIALEHDIAASRSDSLGLAAPITEYRMTCLTGSAPGLTVYVGGAHAVTCFAGVCYLLVP
jgi:hypothetical protein